MATTAPLTASRTVAVGSVPAKVAPGASRLAVTTTFWTSAGTAAVSTVIVSASPVPAWVTPGPEGWL